MTQDKVDSLNALGFIWAARPNGAGEDSDGGAHISSHRKEEADVVSEVQAETEESKDEKNLQREVPEE